MIVMKKKLNLKFGLLLSTLACSVFAATQARAEVLEQKWVAGQQLAYDFNLNGTMRFTAPAQIPMIGGLPLEMQIIGDGQNTFDTREVDDFGSALVVPRLERMHFKFNETTFNQNGSVGVRDGRANFLLNGQNMGGTNMDVSRITDPDYALRFTKNLRVTGAVPLRKEATPEPATADKKPETNTLPIDVPAAMQAMIVRAIPPLLPLQDVSIGDTWNANVEWPTAPGVAPGVAPRPPAGQFTFKALAVEEVAGRSTWRIAVDGTMKASEVSTRSADEALEKRRQEGQNVLPFKLPNFLSIAQKMKGDIWFDPAAGQIVKMDARIETTSEGRNVTGKDTDGVMNFNGRLKMDLRKISFAGGQ